MGLSDGMYSLGMDPAGLFLHLTAVEGVWA